MQHVFCQERLVRDRIGEIVKLYGAYDLAAILIFSKEEVQKGGLSPAVSSNKTKLPVSIDLKADMVKNRVIAGRVRKAKIFYPDHRHKNAPPFVAVERTLPQFLSENKGKRICHFVRDELN